MAYDTKTTWDACGAAFDRYTSTKPAWHYEVIAPGFKYNLSDLAAAIGIQQLKKAWNFQRRRAEMAARYDAELVDQPVILPPHADGEDIHSWLSLIHI